jgi:hypothetical protein
MPDSVASTLEGASILNLSPAEKVKADANVNVAVVLPAAIFILPTVVPFFEMLSVTLPVGATVQPPRLPLNAARKDSSPSISMSNRICEAVGRPSRLPYRRRTPEVLGGDEVIDAPALFTLGPIELLATMK